jgi:hypothetical protein
MTPLICAREGCEEKIETKKSHNQIYCTDECCRIATNKRIMRRYYNRKDRLNGKVRICQTCPTRLSRYNPTDECSACAATRIESINKDLLGMLENAFSEIK